MDEYKYPAEKIEWAKDQMQGVQGSQTGVASSDLSQGWGGTYPPPAQHQCPRCGYCSCCGRGGGYAPNYPPPNYSWTPWIEPWTVPYCSGTALYK